MYKKLLVVGLLCSMFGNAFAMKRDRDVQSDLNQDQPASKKPRPAHISFKTVYPSKIWQKRYDRKLTHHEKAEKVFNRISKEHYFAEKVLVEI